MTTSQVAVQSNIWQNNSILKQKRQNTNKQNYMPFLFRSKRQFPFEKDQMPPVGAYHVPGTFDKLKDGVSSQPQILKEQFQRKNQMCIFKSSQQRFSHNKNTIPGPASYNYLNTDSRAKLFKALNQKVDINKKKEKFQLIKRSPSCPAIPGSNLKYGYAKDPEGKFKLIQKTQTQVQKEKQKLKEYCSTLVGENKYSRHVRAKQQNFGSNKLVNQQKVISKLEKYVDKRSSSLNQSIISLKNKSLKMTKPKVKLSHGANVVKQSNDHLGPGCYNVSLDTLKKGQKIQNYQFFSSSQIRFAPLQKQPNNNPYEHIFNEKKNLRLKPNFQGKIYKKSFPTSVDPTCFEKLQNPGPGYYEPEVENVKKSHGNVKFGYESRFKENNSYIDNQNDQQRYIEEQIQAEQSNNMKWGNLRKEKIKSPHKHFEPVKQQEIYGIMNEEPNGSKTNIKKTWLTKDSKNKESAVFLDRSSRLNLGNKTYHQGESEVFSKQEGSKLWDTKGSFVSKLPKKYIEMKENTPGPGAYDKQKLGKKSFNIKNV